MGTHGQHHIKEKDLAEIFDFKAFHSEVMERKAAEASLTETLEQFINKIENQPILTSHEQFPIEQSVFDTPEPTTFESLIMSVIVYYQSDLKGEAKVALQLAQEELNIELSQKTT